MRGRERLFSFCGVSHTMRDRKRIKYCILVVLVIMVCLHLHLGYFCAEKSCAVSPYPSNSNTPSGVIDGTERHPSAARLRTDTWERRVMERVVLESRPRRNCARDNPDKVESARGGVLLQNHTTLPLNAQFILDPEGDRDVLVFLHIQKTGGTTFGRHLVTNLELETPCRCRHDRKKCECRNGKDKIWAVSRYSTGWRCGLHADWTELTQCVDNMLDKVESGTRERRYLYLTILRDPYSRYISEFKHVQRGATWKATRLQCDGRQASLEEVPFCFEGSDWAGVTLDQFTECPHNLANNRQVRMLANLSLSSCYKRDAMSPESRDCIMLRSAKRNLRQMAFFGLTEYQQETQYLFERTFGLRFQKSFFQYNHTHSNEVPITPYQRNRIHRLNKLDVELYKYATYLFFQRLQNMIKEESTWRNTLGTYSDNGKNWVKSQASTHELNDYDEGDENDADDDDGEYNNRIMDSDNKGSRLTRG